MANKSTILIVDDEKNTRRSLSLVFRRRGYKAETAATGREALDKAQGRFFNLALIDIRLPDMEGVELIAPLKEIHPDIVVILATGYASLENALQALNSGASAYITKPLNLEEVLTAVEEALEKQHLQLENKRLYKVIQQELTDRKRAEAKILQLNRELATLNKVSHAITSTLDLKVTLTIIMEQVAKLLNTAAASVVLVDEERGDAWFAAASGEGADFIRGRRLPLGQGIAGWVVQNSQPLLVPDVSQDSRWMGDFDRESGFITRSILCVPMQTKGEIIGAIEVVNKENGIFEQEDLRLLSSLAAPAATAIENAQLYDKAQREIAERKRTEEFLRILNSAGLAMERALTTDEVFSTAAAALREIGFLCTILQADADQTTITPIYLSYPPSTIEAAEKLVDIKPDDISIEVDSSGIARQVIRNRKTVFVEDVASSIKPLLPKPAKNLANRLATILELTRFIAAPLIVDNKVIGMFAVQSSNLTEDDMTIVTAFAHQIAASWRKTSLMQELEDSLEELRQTQSQLIQAQKMEAIGRLAGGMAHDFNNLLTTIMLYTQMLLRKPNMPPDLAPSLETILDESRRATDLVQKILDFSRRSIVEVQTIELRIFLEQIIEILDHTLPATIHLSLDAEPGEYTVRADPTQIQQVVMNLAVNARDAMDKGGELSFNLTHVVTGPDSPPPTADMPDGKWVRLTISDTGVGMPSEVLSHLFEPFFTTKPVGEGTGLGLAQVYGIVAQHQGYIDVQSEEDQGTTFHIFLPAYESQVKEEKASPRQPALTAPQGQGETILLVEDNDKVRQVAQDILRSLGYRVLTARNGIEAMEVYRSIRQVDLLITDLVMPKMGGKELIQELRKKSPQLKGLAITGYVLADDFHDLKETGILDVVYKPFDLNTLGETVRRVLDLDGTKMNTPDQMGH